MSQELGSLLSKKLESESINGEIINKIFTKNKNEPFFDINCKLSNDV